MEREASREARAHTAHLQYLYCKKSQPGHRQTLSQHGQTPGLNSRETDIQKRTDTYQATPTDRSLLYCTVLYLSLPGAHHTSNQSPPLRRDKQGGATRQPRA